MSTCDEAPPDAWSHVPLDGLPPILQWESENRQERGVCRVVYERQPSIIIEG